MKTASGALKNLLEITSRKQFVGGKPQQQVIACVLRPTEDGASASTTSLVRDGRTSIGTFTIGAQWTSDEEGIVIPDIDRLIGVLSAHSGEVELLQDGSMLRVKSGKKRTSLNAEAGALAFPHSNETISEWEEKSVGLSAQISEDGYIMRDGSTREPFAKVSLPCGELAAAMRCDNINGQKLNQFQFLIRNGGLLLNVGDFLKGQTEIELLETGKVSSEDFETILEGGIDQIISSYSGEVHIHFIDFRPEGQGIRAIIRFDNGDWIYQAAVLKR
jgi:hypothetical protein